MAQQARDLGLPPEAAAALAAAARRGDAAGAVAVFPENWPAVRVFVAMGTQWRRAGMGGVATGLDYAALPAVCGMLALPADEDLLARLRTIEGAAVTAMAEARGR